MRTDRFAFGTLVLSLAACGSARAQEPATCAQASSACAQQAEARARKADACARDAELAARHAEEVAQENEAHARVAEAYARDAELAARHAEEVAQENEACARKAEACARENEARAKLDEAFVKLGRQGKDKSKLEKMKVEKAKLEKACALEAEVARAVAEQCRVEAQVAQDAAMAEMSSVHELVEEACKKAGMETQHAQEVVLRVNDELARQMELVDAQVLGHHLEALAELSNEMDDDHGVLARHLQALGQGRGSSPRLEERIRALEERLGVHHEDDGRSLEERVAELERRTQGDEDRRPRVISIPGGRRALAGPRGPGAGGGVPGFAPPRHPLPGVEPTVPAPPVEAIPPMAPAPPATPGPEMHLRHHVGSTAPSAPRRVRTLSASGLTADRRQEIEEVMQRMRVEMERLREEMNHLRSRLGRNDGIEKLRRLGYIDESEDEDDSEDSDDSEDG